MNLEHCINLSNLEYVSLSPSESFCLSLSRSTSLFSEPECGSSKSSKCRDPSNLPLSLDGSLCLCLQCPGLELNFHRLRLMPPTLPLSMWRIGVCWICSDETFSLCSYCWWLFPNSWHCHKRRNTWGIGCFQTWKPSPKRSILGRGPLLWASQFRIRARPLPRASQCGIKTRRPPPLSVPIPNQDVFRSPERFNSELGRRALPWASQFGIIIIIIIGRDPLPGASQFGIIWTRPRSPDRPNSKSGRAPPPPERPTRSFSWAFLAPIT